ncbi:MAG: ATP-dependent DNA helicase [Proteobacteria bacterium]|nr:ATP-dependent DNA helicase [Pseudomonadota bacterium]
MKASPESTTVTTPDAPALVAGVGGGAMVSADGEVESVSGATLAGRLSANNPPLVCHARATARRLGMAPFPARDVLELFAFARPATFCLPTPRGVARVLGLPEPDGLAAEAASLHGAARHLLGGLNAMSELQKGEARRVAWAMARGGWTWGPTVLAALDAAGDMPHGTTAATGLRVWTRLREWEEPGPQPPPGNLPVEPVEARARLVQLLGNDAEERPQQREYASAAAAAFMPRDAAGHPRMVLAEAGTGVGKTLGYLAPAHVWARKNKGTVWISTFTRNLQRQLDAELDKVYPDPDDKRRKVVVRKGRENYLCLLNMDEAVARLQSAGAGEAVALGLMARWALASRDGDMIGGDFPAWLADLLGRASTVEMTDSRGECVYAACPHYKRCFIEKSVRRARRAEIVVANHALVMIQAAMGGGDEGSLPPRYVLDEGHHLFHAADSAFSAQLSGMETAELRRWILGAEGRRRSRSRGLKERVGDLIAGDTAAEEQLDEALHAVRALPGPGWQQRIAGGTPVGAAESFLALVRQQVYARDKDAGAPYDIETEPRPAIPGLLDAATVLDGALDRLRRPLTALVGRLAALLDDEADTLETATRVRIEATMRGLERRGNLTLNAWRSMLKDLSTESPAAFVDWFGVERNDGNDLDVGYNRHWIDPMQPFAEVVAEPAHGLLVTSASLRDDSGDAEADWQTAERISGANHLPDPPQRTAVLSPFDYPALTRVLVIGDVRRNDVDQVSAAYRELFKAAGGGGLGLFTAIHRLRAVHRRIAGPLEEAGIPLLAQHVSGLDTGTLIDIFREEPLSCLLGTDAVRDGVDVPGRSLRLIVFDRVPWPRPNILHKARREQFGGRAYDEMLTRLKLKQAYGRLVRRADDKGVFVMLDSALPTRLLTAFPEGVEVKRIGLAEAVKEVAGFLGETLKT